MLHRCRSFSALQRAEIAEMFLRLGRAGREAGVSVLFNEPKLLKCDIPALASGPDRSFSALQRAEIAEIYDPHLVTDLAVRVSVLFNEPKLLKFETTNARPPCGRFQCSSTSRNC